MNTELWLSRLLQDKPSSPDVGMISISLTNLCNLSCGYCFARKGGQISLGMAFKALAFARREFGTDVSLILFGGEPLIRWEFFKKVIGKARELGLWNFAVCTNGLLLNSEILDFFEQNHLGMTVSFDGIGQAHDYGRKTKTGTGTFEKLLDRLTLLRMRKSLNPLFRFTVTPNTCRTLDETYAFIAQMFPRTHINIMPAATESWSAQDFEILKKSLLRLADVAVTLAKTDSYVPIHYNECVLHGELSTILTLKQEKDESCRWGARMLGIDAKGDVYPCCILPEMGEESKSIFKMGSMDSFQSFWKRLEKRNPAQSCHVWNRIFGGNCDVPLPIYRHFFEGFVWASHRLLSRMYPEKINFFYQMAINKLEAHSQWN